MKLEALVAPIAFRRFPVRARARLVSIIRATVVAARQATGAAGEARAAWVMGPLDNIYAFLSATHTITVANLFRLARTNASSLYSAPLRTAAMIIGHVYIFYEISHPLPAGLSLFAFTMPGFALWVLFANAFHKANPRELALSPFRGRKIQLPTFVAYNLCIELFGSLAGVVLSFGYFYLIDDRMSLGYINHFNLGYFVALMVLSFMLGTTLGAFAHKIVEIIPIFSPMLHILLPIMFLTSGAYTAFADQPEMAQDVLIYNPVVPIVECGRQAMNPLYSISSLTLYYPIGMMLVFAFMMLAANKNAKTA